MVQQLGSIILKSYFRIKQSWLILHTIAKMKTLIKVLLLLALASVETTFASSSEVFSFAISSSTPDSTIILRYPLNNASDGNSGFNRDSFNSNLLASSAIASGPGLSLFSVGPDNWAPTIDLLKTAPGTSVSGATAADAISNNWYFEITLTPKTSVNLQGVSVDWSRGGTTAVRGWFVRSSLDGYATNLYANETPVGTPTGLSPVSFNLTGFKNLSTAITFRFYIYTDRTGRYMDFQNIAFFSSPCFSVNINNKTEPSSGQSNGSINVDVNSSSLMRYCRWSTKEGINHPSVNDFDLSNAPEGTYYLMLFGDECVEYAGPYTLGNP